MPCEDDDAAEPFVVEPLETDEDELAWVDAGVVFETVAPVVVCATALAVCVVDEAPVVIVTPLGVVFELFDPDVPELFGKEIVSPSPPIALGIVIVRPPESVAAEPLGAVAALVLGAV